MQPCSWLENVRGWKEFCRMYTLLERNWEGHGSALKGTFWTNERACHFKVDEDQKTLLTVLYEGGLTVRALEDKRLLWGLRKDYVPRCRIEYAQGFLVFPNSMKGLEVWRRSYDALRRHRNDGEAPFISTPVQEPSPVAAQTFQFRQAHHAAEQCSGIHSALNAESLSVLRGHFTPHAYLSNLQVQPLTLYRLAFPHLVVISEEDYDAVLLFDIVTGVQLQRISWGSGQLIGRPSRCSLSELLVSRRMDIDVTDTYVLVCLIEAIVVVPRDRNHSSGNTKEVVPQLVVLEEYLAPHVCQSTAKQVVKRNRWNHFCNSSVENMLGSVADGNLLRVEGASVTEPFDVVPSSSKILETVDKKFPWHGYSSPSEEVETYLESARFSPDGRHIAAVTLCGMLYLIRDFERLLHGTATFADVVERTYMADSLKEVVWVEPYRLVVQGSRSRLYIVDLGPAWRSEGKEMPSGSSGDGSHLGMSVLKVNTHERLMMGRSNTLLQGVLQVTKTTIWTVYTLPTWDVIKKKQSPSQRIWATWKWLAGSRYKQGDGHCSEVEDTPEGDVPVPTVCCISFLPNDVQ
ncbi:hypothetical protein A0H81_02149 [Grifola frondosa]|uniref:Uncharacterized protein n=1 Tax=Grifola frondosa TaxID=5627 RepID=A0A1C7MNL3_GRIFR|nr:hypothetical protein A0H81_02149 [Grifola frondosa]